MWGVTEMLKFNIRKITVSIHTPVWGVTIAEITANESKNVSIHTPVWGVTSYPFLLNL